MHTQRWTKLATAASGVLVRHLSNKTCIFTRPHRRLYLRQYPVLVVQPNGSTYTIRYEEPRCIIKLPLDISTLSEEEKLQILEERRPRKKIQHKTEEVQEFNRSAYLKYLKEK